MVNYISWEHYGTHRELHKAKIEKLILLFLVGGFAVFVGLQAILK